MSAKKKLIIDVDTGTDDAQAIMMALSHPAAEVVAITCVHGNVFIDQVCKNTLRVLEACDRLDVPVYKGAAQSILGEHSGESTFYHGGDGLGDVPDADPPPLSLVQSEHAVDAIIRLPKEHPGELTLVALAPLTNIALAQRMDPSFSKNLKEIVIMGGNMSAVGNILPCKEYNFYCDAEAASITLNELLCPIILVPLEPTVSHGALDYEFYEKEIVPLTTPKALFHHKIITITDARRRMAIGLCAVCDVNAMAIALEPDIVTKSSQEYCTVELHGQLTRSQVVVDWKHHLGKEPNVLLVQEYSMDRFKQMYKDLFM